MLVKFLQILNLVFWLKLFQKICMKKAFFCSYMTFLFEKQTSFNVKLNIGSLLRLITKLKTELDFILEQNKISIFFLFLVIMLLQGW